MPLYWLTGKDYQQAIGQITHHRRDARRCDWPTDASVGHCALGAYGSPTPHTHPPSFQRGGAYPPSVHRHLFMGRIAAGLERGSAAVPVNWRREIGF